MKRFSKFVLLAALATLAVGCGKDNKSGGGSSSSLYTSNVELSSSSKSAAQNFQRWMEANVTNSNYGNFAIYFNSSTNAGTSSNCVEKEFLGIPYYYCSGYSSNSGSTSDGCKTTVLGGTYETLAMKLQNPTLNKIYRASSNGMVLVEASQSNTSSYLNNVYRLTFQDQSGGVDHGSIKTYTIDTQYPAAFQPLLVTESDGSYKAVSGIYTSAQVGASNYNALSACGSL